MKTRKSYRKIIGISLLAGLGWYLFFALPRPLFDTPYSVVLEDRNGELLAARIADDGQWRFPPPDRLPDKYVQALIHFEDQRFFRHIGVDFRAIARAIAQNLRSRRIVSGASTITMQTIRLARGNRQRNLWNKAMEIILATRLELARSKPDILRLYAAQAPFGGNVVGLDAAAWRYFGKGPQFLSWAEAATLAVLPNSPGLIHPGRNRDALRAKRDRLLKKLAERGLLDATGLELAMAEELPGPPLPLPRYTPHLLEKAARDYQAGALATPRVKSTIDLLLQQQFNTRVRQHRELLEANQIHNAAAILIHIPSNRILAYVGNAPGAGAIHSEMVDILDAPRSTGSILKPFLYALALEDGLILPGSLLRDVPSNFNGYRPENYHRGFHGAIPADDALARSLNVPFVHLLQEYGLERFHRQLQKMGMTTLHRGPDHYGLTLILGGAEGRLLDITAMYAQLGRTVNQYTQNSSQYGSDPAPVPVYTAEKPGPQANLVGEPPLYGAGAAWHTLQAMQEVQRPSSEGQWETFSSGRRIAWKTGTSFGFRDAWAVGLTPEYALGVWVGNADGEGRPGLVGVQAAAPLLFDLFAGLPATGWFETPHDDLHTAAICPQSGNLAGQYCPIDSLLVPNSVQARALCTGHRVVHLNREGSRQVTANCYPPFDIQHRKWFVLPPLEAYYYKRFHPEYLPLPPLDPRCTNTHAEGNMQLISPRNPSRIYVPVDIDGSLSRVVFEIAHPDEQAQLHWHLDEAYLGSTRTFHSMEFNPAPGTHLLTVVDNQGYRLEQAFEILSKERK